MIKELLKKNMIQLQVLASSWEDAIRVSAKPLLDASKIEESYIEKMIEVVKETGPYIVITKNVALPHAPVGFGSKEIGLSLTVLKKSVCFNHTENDPVKYLFCLSAIDSSSHLELLSELVNYLEDELFLSLLDKAEKPEEILSYIGGKR